MGNIWGASQWCRLTQETEWSVFNGTAETPAVGATVHWVDLMEDAFVPTVDPHSWEIVTASGNMIANSGSVRKGIGAKLHLPLFPSQAVDLCPWFATPTGTGSARALPSFTVDIWNGISSARYTGCRVSQAVIGSDDSDQGQTVMLDLDLIARDMIDDGTLDFSDLEPAVSAFASTTERPYTHVDLASQLLIDGSAVTTGVQALKITYQNILKTAFHESTRINRCNIRGRRISAEVTIGQEAETNRKRFESVGLVAMKAGWLISGTPDKKVLFDLQGRCKIGSFAFTSKFDDDRFEQLTFTPLRDGTTGLDGVLSVA